MYQSSPLQSFLRRTRVTGSAVSPRRATRVCELRGLTRGISSKQHRHEKEEMVPLTSSITSKIMSFAMSVALLFPMMVTVLSGAVESVSRSLCTYRSTPLHMEQNEVWRYSQNPTDQGTNLNLYCAPLFCYLRHGLLVWTVT